MRIATTVIKGSDGKPLIINADEFDAEKHELFDLGASPPEPTPGVVPAAPVAHDANGNAVNAGDGGYMTPTPVANSVDANGNPITGAGVPATPLATPPADAGKLLVTKDGKKFVVVNEAGEPVERDGIAANYKTETDAWNAILALGSNNA